MVSRSIDAQHLLQSNDGDATNGEKYECVEYYLGGEPESSLVAGLRTGVDLDVRQKEQTQL